MTQLELQQYLLCEYPQENARCGIWESKRLVLLQIDKRINN